MRALIVLAFLPLAALAKISTVRLPPFADRRCGTRPEAFAPGREDAIRNFALCRCRGLALSLKELVYDERHLCMLCDASLPDQDGDGVPDDFDADKNGDGLPDGSAPPTEYETQPYGEYEYEELDTNSTDPCVQCKLQKGARRRLGGVQWQCKGYDAPAAERLCSCCRLWGYSTKEARDLDYCV